MKRSGAKRPSERFALFLLFCMLTAILGCGDDVSGPDDNDAVASEDFYYRFDVSEQVRLTVSGVSGEITITGIAGSDSIVVKGTRRVKSWDAEDAAEHLELLVVTVQNQAGVVSAETDQPSESEGRDYEVDYEIIIPVALEVNATNVNGITTVSNIERRVTASAVNGMVVLDEIAASVSATVVNGSVAGDVTLPLDGLISMGVTNGEIDLDIPEDTSAEFSAAVVNGNISISNLVLHDMESTSLSVTGRLGEGRGTVSLSAVNGTIDVEGF